MPNLRHALLTTTLIALIGSPIAAAGWAAFGNHEPDTQADVNDGFLFNSPYTGALNKVYFNGFYTANDLNYGSPSPNVDGLGLVQTGVNPTQGALAAVLGVWSDCNGDGYVGLADQGLWEYRAEVLTVAPPARGISPECQPTARPLTDAGLASWHNDGQWVREMVPIGWTQGCPTTPACTQPPADYDPYDINDNAARVWVDAGHPQDDTTGNGGGSCSINPPVGSMHSTGGLLWWLGCGEGYAAIDFTNGVTESAGLGKLVFGDVQDHKYYESHSPANQKNPWGNQGDASVDGSAWDCNAPKTFSPRDPTSPSDGQPGQLWRVKDPTGVAGDQDGWINITFSDGYFVHGANVSGIGSPSPNAGGSPAGTVNDTAAGTDSCNRDSSPGGGRGGTAANAPYSQETDIGTNQHVTKKANADAVLYTGYGTNEGIVDAAVGGFGLTGLQSGGRADQFEGNLYNRVNAPAPVGPVHHGAGNATTSVLGASAPLMLGTNVASNAGVWHDDLIHSGDTLTALTFYAYVTPQPWLSFKGATGVYGSDHCDNGASLGNATWECDASKWWRGSGDVDNSPRSAFLGKDPGTEPTAECSYIGINTNTDSTTRGCYEIAPYPGAPYNLRDQDCFDWNVAAARTTGLSTPPVNDPTKVASSGPISYSVCGVVNENP